AVFQAGYSKDQELEADREGTRLAVLSGYSPLGAVRLFEAFERMEQHRSEPAPTPADEAARVALGTLSGYFQSHPYAAERKAQIERMIGSDEFGRKLEEKPLEMGGVNAGH